MNFDLITARQLASEGRIEDWIHSYLTAGEWANQPLSDGLKRQQRWWLGPFEVQLDLLKRACGPEADMEFIMNPVDWQQRTSRLAESFTDLEKIPPLIVEYRSGVLSIRDGNHRHQAMRLKSWQTCWIVLWFNSSEEYDEFLPIFHLYNAQSIE